MNFIPEKIFILENNQYKEITFEKFCWLRDTESVFENKKFICLYGMLMEVTLADYKEFYKVRRRQKYLLEQSRENKDVSFNKLTTDEFNGEDVLIDISQDVCETVVSEMMLEKLRESMDLLAEEEQELINALYFNNLSEREYSAMVGVPQTTINYRKNRILSKLKKFMEK